MLCVGQDRTTARPQDQSTVSNCTYALMHLCAYAIMHSFTYALMHLHTTPFTCTFKTYLQIHFSYLHMNLI